MVSKVLQAGFPRDPSKGSFCLESDADRAERARLTYCQFPSVRWNLMFIIRRINSLSGFVLGKLEGQNEVNGFICQFKKRENNVSFKNIQNATVNRF